MKALWAHAELAPPASTAPPTIIGVARRVEAGEDRAAFILVSFADCLSGRLQAGQARKPRLVDVPSNVPTAKPAIGQPVRPRW